MLILASTLKNPLQAMIEDAAVWVQGDRVAWVGRRSDLPREAGLDPEKIELQDTLLIPGLVNAHAHLELTGLKGLPYPGSFSKWIRAILASRDLNANKSTSGISEGVRKIREGGATTVADHIAVTGDLEALLNSPLRGIALVEVLGVNPEVAWDILEASLLLEREFGHSSPRWRLVPTPHSVHALHPDVLVTLLERPFPLFSIHLAESGEEMEYFQKKSGELYKLIAERGTELPREETSAIRELQKNGRLDSRILIIHGNYLDEEESAWVAAQGCSVVHCPLSHRYFSHRPFPMRPLLEKGVNIALGTDSLASAASLSMFDVLRTADRSFPGVDREQIFAMATLGGAKALKMEGEIGRIASGLFADLVGVDYRGASEELAPVFQAEAVKFSMIGGNL